MTAAINRAAMLMIAPLLVVAAGCGATSGDGPRSGRIDRSSAGSVALAFDRDLYARRFVAAESLMDPASARVLQRIADTARLPRARASHLAAGAVVPAGDGVSVGGTATVTITGTFCNDSDRAQPCVTNSDRGSTDPRFEVFVTKRSDGTWQVAAFNPGQAGVQRSGGVLPRSSAAVRPARPRRTAWPRR